MPRDLGDYPAAKAAHERALAIAEAAPSPDHPNTKTIQFEA
jgi:hypothetical protein